MATKRKDDGTKEIQCEVLQNIKEWPYVRRCRGSATHTIRQDLRHLAGGYEFICDECTSRFWEAYGEDATLIRPGYEYTNRLEND